MAEGTAPGTAVFKQTGPFQGPADVTNAGGLSPYGTMGQGGNSLEWMETAYDGVNDTISEGRAVRGGNWGSPDIEISYRPGPAPPTADLNIGFRVAASQ